ncbi:uncharacterized protein PAC_15193 [Phialocephala subalpina]|uniref:Ubiquitin-like protease family profile domain-containing protein n=1 Tax=Phialocephala subalpina TaxID=576137 RepID=A0A1L7XJW0_9HELO|nr:uncharacterized protein PAC_15193 [Phialocephala subalpina]
MWINMLEAGHARSKEYDAELEQAEKAPPSTKRGTPRKRLATVVLDKYLKEARDTTAIEGPEKLTSKGNEDRLSSLDSAGIQKRILDTRKKRLNNIFHKGRILRKLAQKTRLGILFDPDIWSYAKASKENIDKIAALFQADPQKIELLSILDKQVELGLESTSGVRSRKSKPMPSLGFGYMLMQSQEPVPQGCLDTAINRVVKEISHVLGKHPLDKDDSIMVNSAIELSYGMFDRLRSREWLNCWEIAAALEMTDRPIFVQLGLSVPLHKKDANGEVTPISNPLRRWRKKIDDCRRKGKNDLERPQVYICPLNANTNHFTLLEINEQTKMIYHYDSMASHESENDESENDESMNRDNVKTRLIEISAFAAVMG